MSQGHLSNRTYWWSASTGLYVYYSSAYTAWILDTDILVSNGVADYIISSAYFPPSSAYWTYLTASNPVITCGDTGSTVCTCIRCVLSGSLSWILCPLSLQGRWHGKPTLGAPA